MSQRTLDRQSAEAVRRQDAQALRGAVGRLWRLGLTDNRIRKVLGVRKATVKALREELGLPANKGGGQ
jgi:hypothetical protein